MLLRQLLFLWHKCACTVHLVSVALSYAFLCFFCVCASRRSLFFTGALPSPLCSHVASILCFSIMLLHTILSILCSRFHSACQIRCERFFLTCLVLQVCVENDADFYSQFDTSPFLTHLEYSMFKLLFGISRRPCTYSVYAVLHGSSLGGGVDKLLV